MMPATQNHLRDCRKVKKLQRYDEGSKQRYFADDDQRSLEDLVKEQRHGGGRDMDANLAENIARKARFRSVQHGTPGCCNMEWQKVV